MVGFFRGWRRKLGCVTLMTACVFMAGWVRSRSYNECVQIPVSQHSRVGMGSTNQVLGVACQTVADPSENQFDFFSNPEEGSIADVLSINGNVPLQSIGSDMEWRILCGDFAMGRSEYLPDFDTQYIFAIVPYWSIVISLTVLSFAVLFSRLRSTIETKSFDPTTEKPIIHFGRFITGWRRKAGLVTLVMACVFAGVWVTSYGHERTLLEVTRRQNEHDQHDRLISLPGEFVWAEARNLNASHSFTDYFGILGARPDKPPPYGNLVCGIPINWRWHILGIRYGVGLDAEGDNACLIVVISFWIIIISLTIVSAYFLISKPRKSIPKSSADSIPNKTSKS